MEKLERFLSRPTAKPYKTSDLEASEEIHLNRDGLLEFSPDDIENPINWSTTRRWYITCIAIILVLNATFASSSPSGALGSIANDLHVSTEAGALVITLFLLGYCAGPLVFAPLSEFFGRRYVFYVTFTLYLTFNFLCAFAPNFGALLVGRFFAGIFASAPLSNAGGVLADIWGPLERGNAMAVFSMVTFIGPALGPVISGFLELKKNWRWSFYVLLWMGGITELLMFTLPETLPAIVLRNKAKRLRALKIPGYENVRAPVEVTDRTLQSLFRAALIRPWKILIDPIAFAVAIYLTVVYALLYMLFTIYPIVFQERRGWNSGVGELPLLGTAIGAVIGGSIIFANTARERKKVESGYKLVPEDRLPVAMIGGIVFPITMFWFAWSGEYNSVHWIVPTLAGVFLATSILLVFVAYLNYLTDAYIGFAASALAGNTVVRSAAGAAAPLFTPYMFKALGVGGGGSLIGGLACLLAPIPFIFYKYGGPIRERSKFAREPNRDSEPITSEPIASELSVLDRSDDSDRKSET
ncbi:MFS general substrate transporter [Didymella exigua CBS 183.55]|uniref:MFS general substrate transporter n=1 Tax=Didymella exigua CBS 183.55 TaxID=1150837 RepID=A0A6A5R7D1_9PLEO|nr:MFS general substrate transporter [Didymella exigua CBS 183.55]KAF1923088.1 MFS general substrate transporter [Didymella exigua CBS 183.55]